MSGVDKMVPRRGPESEITIPDTGVVVRVTAATSTRVDLHVKILDGRVVDRAKARGIDVLVYAPHFTRLPDIQARAAAFSDDDLLVVPARELFTGSWRNRRHVLGVGLTEPVPDFITLEATLSELDRQGAAVLVPHPNFANVSLDTTDVEVYADDIDAIEVYNPKNLPWHNTHARTLHETFDIPPFGSSYAHLRGTVGEVWTEFDARIESEADLVDALENGASRRVAHRDGANHVRRRITEFLHLGWENTYGKVDRLLLSGTEPTHPKHVAYDGKFDHASCY